MEPNVLQALYEEAKKAKTAEEIVELAKAKNVPITLENAKAFLKSSGELSENELENVSGGCPGFKSDHDEIYIGNTVAHESGKRICYCGGTEGVVQNIRRFSYNKDIYIEMEMECTSCHNHVFDLINGYHITKW